MKTNILVETINCPKCKGKGKVTYYSPRDMHNQKKALASKGHDKKLWKATRSTCHECHGAGAIIDSTIPDIILNLGIKRYELPMAMQKINEHIAVKLEDSYKRGKKDGKKIRK